MHYLPQPLLLQPSHPKVWMAYEDKLDDPSEVHELDAKESKSFIIGFANGMWMSGALAALGYLLLHRLA